MIKLLKIEKLSEGNLVNTAVFGAIWGLAEVSLGSFLHASKIPFRGAIMSLVAVLILISARSVLKYKGSLILLGVVTATFRLFLGIGFNITPFVAIIMEALIAELIINKIGFNRWTSVFSGILIMVYSLSHGLIMQALFLGTDIYKVYYEMILKVTNMISLPENVVLSIIFSIPFVYIFMGAITGFFGWSVGKQIQLLMEKK